ncbi:chemotaxis protein CheA [Vibrio cholerae]|uniref:chemotaxis protein CheA n=1 Tax=Vibrio cholerae TaxID=666 RepID=UPI000E0B4951|nr:chemotaxis protein CheA [Vibrio cholerae]EGR0940984.1 chemotaxis protein CheA [Vibrio cholerae]EGR1419096.1 chemotaxis protein CheA [Vibrio cholerae]EHU8077807.1 chemotaxis protein CheA [Vibrio cholerae]EHV9953863.1 chemotaxis protein CheA [Vibrio cholerae]EIA0775731.1 chemotaxis protein CheA [Vibrio cholerae]
MALDMEQLRKIFHVECRENLETLEGELLQLDPSQVDLEVLNTIFRAAHSIKGGAGTFNLHEISEFTHAVETYLDLIRNQKKQLTAQGVDTLLKSCDVIRNMLDSREQETAIDEALKQQVGAELQALLADQGADRVMSPAQPVSSNTHASNTYADAIATPDATAQAWRIRFVPHQTLFYSGNDPLRILRELRELGSEYQIELDHQALPELAEIDPELCYLSWTIWLTGDVSENDVRELFDWVEDECDLHIAPILSDEASTHVEDEQAAPAATLQSTPQTQVEPVAIVDLPEVEPPVATVAPVIANPKESATNKPAKTDSSVSSIRVDIEKVDNLINLVGELVITQSMLTELGNDFSMDKLDKLKAGLAQLLQNSKDLQENVLNIRMLPMSFAFSRFPRLVRDLCGRLGKKVDLQIQGEQTELDKTVLERIVDPLVHLVRNGIDHGVEMPDIRLAKGKPETGVITLNAFHQGGSIIVEISDDGAGIDCDKLWRKAVEKGVLEPQIQRSDLTDKQIINLIFAPGFSTAEQVSDISGRGVGMDVVRRNIEELGGQIEVDSELGRGSRFTISLPLTLAILDGQLVKVADQVYVIPLLTIVESIQINTASVKHAAGGIELYRLREENIPILRLQDELAMGRSGSLEKRLICFVESAGHRVGLLVDDLLDQQQVVIKSLESNYAKVAGISGATILGDGSVSLILDIPGLIAHFMKRSSSSTTKGKAA